MKYYPIAVNLKNKNAVVVGGGAVAQRKVLSLLCAKARVTIVSLTATRELKNLVKDKKVAWIRHAVRESDLKGADIVVAATSDRNVNKDVRIWSRKTGALVNVVDDRLLSDFISPAVFKKGQAIIAVYTDGRQPELSRDLKDYLKERWDEFLSHRNRP